MLLSELKRGESAIIKSVTLSKALKHRLYSLGVHKGSNIFVDEFSLAKATIKVIIDNTMTALRFDEAKNIEVEKIKV